MADDTRDLLVRVDASIALLRQHLAEGDAPIGKFEQRANRMAQNVDRAIGEMGKRFGVFGEMAQNAATQAEKAFNDSFTQIQQLAAKAIAGPTIKGGGVNLGSVEMRQAAEAAKQQALAIGLVEQAAHRAAAGEHELTAETRMYLQAASAARIEAERHANDLAREAGALERLEIEMQQAGAGAKLLEMRQNEAANAGRMQGTSMMMAGQQIQDFAVQVSSGQSVATAFGQQIGQLAFAVQGMGGKFAGVAAFLQTPWGIALTVAVVALTPFVAKLFEGNDALEKAVESLKKDARETEINRQAKELFIKTEEGVRKAILDTVDANNKWIESQRTAAQQAAINARAQQLTAQKALADTERQLAAAREQLKAFSGPAGSDPRLAPARQSIEQQVDYLTRLRVTQQKELEALGTRTAQAFVDLADDAAKAAGDPIERIKHLYEGPNGLITQAKSRLVAERATTGEMGRQLAILHQQEQAAIKAEQDRQSAARSGSVPVTPSEVGGMLTGQFGGTVTSTTGGKHVKNSYHYRGQAVDFVPKGGMGSITKDDIRAYLKSQGIVIEELLGPGDKGHSDHFHVAFGKTQRSPEAVATQNQRTEETAAQKAERARQQAIDRDTAYTEEERQARHRLVETTKKTAASEEQRYALIVEDINAEADAGAKKIANQRAAGDITDAQMWHLAQINEATRAQKLQNAAIERATAAIDKQYDAQERGLQHEIAVLQIQQDLATTNAERRRIALKLLDKEQQLAREQLKHTAATSQDPRAVSRALSDLKNLGTVQAAQRAQASSQNLGAFGQWRSDIPHTAEQLKETLESIEVHGLETANNDLSQMVTSALHLQGAFADVGQELIKIALQLAEMELLDFLSGGTKGQLGASKSGGGGGLGGLGQLLGFAGGGDPPVGVPSIVGENGPELFVPRVSGTIIPNGGLRSPSIPWSAMGRGAGGQQQVALRLTLSDDLDARIESRSAAVSVEVMRQAAPQIVEAAVASTFAEAGRPRI